MNRDVVFVNEFRIEFNSNGRRIQRNITRRERERLLELIDRNDEYSIDLFCYGIA